MKILKKSFRICKRHRTFSAIRCDPNSTWFSASARDIENYQRKLSQLRNELLSSNVNTQAVLERCRMPDRLADLNGYGLLLEN